MFIIKNVTNTSRFCLRYILTRPSQFSSLNLYHCDNSIGVFTKHNLNACFFLQFRGPVTMTSVNLLNYIRSLLINTQVFNYMTFYQISWKASMNLPFSVLHWCSCHKMLHLHLLVQNKDKSEVLTTWFMPVRDLSSFLKILSF